MRKIPVILAALLILSGCGVLRCPRQQPELQIRDSLVLHVRDSIAIKYVEVAVPVPVEVMREIIPSSDSSHLETSLATSEAFIDSTGRLHHTLENKAGATIPAIVPVEEHWHSEQEQASHQEQETIIKEVEKPLTWWQRFWQNSGKVFWLLILGALAGWLIRLFVFKR